MITVDLSEQGSLISEMGYHSELVKKYKIRAAPWLLITCQGSVLHNEKMGGFVHRLRYPTLARPRVDAKVSFSNLSSNSIASSNFGIFHTF